MMDLLKNGLMVVSELAVRYEYVTGVAQRIRITAAAAAAMTALRLFGFFPYSYPRSGTCLMPAFSVLKIGET